MLEYIYLNTLVDAAQKNKLLNEKKKITEKKSISPEGKTLLTLRKAPWGRFTSFGGSPSMET